MTTFKQDVENYMNANNVMEYEIFSGDRNLGYLNCPQFTEKNVLLHKKENTGKKNNIIEFKIPDNMKNREFDLDKMELNFQCLSKNNKSFNIMDCIESMELIDSEGNIIKKMEKTSEEEKQRQKRIRSILLKNKLSDLKKIRLNQ